MKANHFVKNFFGRGVFALAVTAATLVGTPLLGTQANVYAEEDNSPAYRLQMSPTAQDIELAPGSNYEGTFKVQNTGSKELKYKVSVAPYSVKDEDYTPDYSTSTDYTMLSSWITLSEEGGTLEPNSSAEIKYSVKVPNNVSGGGQYAVIFAQLVDDSEESATTEGGAAIKAVNRVGMLLYADIDGESRKEGSVVENKIPSFLFNPPITATSLVENTGNIHANATYILQVYPLFSDEEVYTNEENPSVRRIMPETRHFNSVSWDGAPQLGIFKVKQTVKIFDKVSVEEKTVFLCPIWFLFIIILIIVMAIFWVVMRIRNRKKEM